MKTRTYSATARDEPTQRRPLGSLPQLANYGASNVSYTLVFMTQILSAFQYSIDVYE
jgi:hypothetical protein